VTEKNIHMIAINEINPSLQHLEANSKQFCSALLAATL